MAFHTSTLARNYLRNLLEVLIPAGFLVSDVAKLTSHSLNATLLSWVAKAGCPMQIRRALGGTRQGLGPHP